MTVRYATQDSEKHGYSNISKKRTKRSAKLRKRSSKLEIRLGKWRGESTEWKDTHFKRKEGFNMESILILATLIAPIVTGVVQAVKAGFTVKKNLLPFVA